MKIVAFLQNQWYRDPQKARQVFARNPELRERLLARYLFAGCLTGKRLQSVFGEELCDAIIWEEVSPEIGGHSSSRFPADIAHVTRVLDKHKPTAVLAFGKIAGDALRSMPAGWAVIYGPHPAARNGAIEGLRKMRTELSAFKEYR